MQGGGMVQLIKHTKDQQGGLLVLLLFQNRMVLGDKILSSQNPLCFQAHNSFGPRYWCYHYFLHACW
ncbi:Transmembrane domain-containing protein TMIGD3 [Frankliniella fusca]|uniref:Transmembrane domain-containing protein TMIGD3 n=1 Tax=Frankliniella fusca TaxID=407009 RepID=A0AAE1GXB8_9NEOP|nr:Transmembrane domain-containing protein TMIGD3 [Frankliniella fusca]